MYISIYLFEICSVIKLIEHDFSWTQTDTDVTCRQLGFKNGTFSFVSFATNDSMYMLYHKPECQGHEGRITDCPGSARIQIGSRICGMKHKFDLSNYSVTAQDHGQFELYCEIKHLRFLIDFNREPADGALGMRWYSIRNSTRPLVWFRIFQFYACGGAGPTINQNKQIGFHFGICGHRICRCR